MTRRGVRKSCYHRDILSERSLIRTPYVARKWHILPLSANPRYWETPIGCPHSDTMFTYQCFLVALLLAVASAEPHFDKALYQITLTDCRAPQNDLAVIRLLGANATHRVIWGRHNSAMDAISLDAQHFNANDSTRVVRAAYNDSCPLRHARDQHCQYIVATIHGLVVNV